MVHYLKEITVIKDFSYFQLFWHCKALAKLDSIAWQTLFFVSESLGMDKKVTPDLRRKQ